MEMKMILKLVAGKGVGMGTGVLGTAGGWYKFYAVYSCIPHIGQFSGDITISLPIHF